MPALVTKTIKASGGDFASWNAFAGYAGDKNLVTQNVCWEVSCDAFDDTTTVANSLTGWTTDATHYLKVKGPRAPRTIGSIDTGSYRITQANTINIADIGAGGLLILEDIQVAKSGTSGQAITGAAANATPGTVRLHRCQIFAKSSSGSSLSLGATTPNNYECYSCCFLTQGSTTATINRSGGNLTMVGCSIIATVSTSSSNGVNLNSGGTNVLKNCFCYAKTAGNCYYNLGGTTTMTKCGSTDTTGSTGLQSLAFTTANFENVTIGSEDFRLKIASTLLRVGAAIDSEPHVDDLLGRARILTTPDIGAYQKSFDYRLGFDEILEDCYDPTQNALRIRPTGETISFGGTSIDAKEAIQRAYDPANHCLNSDPIGSPSGNSGTMLDWTQVLKKVFNKTNSKIRTVK